MPASPPLTNGSIALTSGVCRKSVVVCFGFSAADLSAAGVSAMVSLVAVDAASVFRFAAFAIIVGVGSGPDIFGKRWLLVKFDELALRDGADDDNGDACCAHNLLLDSIYDRYVYSLQTKILPTPTTKPNANFDRTITAYDVVSRRQSPASGRLYMIPHPCNEQRF